jgi:hypothetical protein
MHILIGLLLFVIGLPVSFAQATCYPVSPDIFTTQEATIAATIRANSEHARPYTCRPGIRQDKEGWWCEQRAGECQRAQVQFLYDTDAGCSFVKPQVASSGHTAMMHAKSESGSSRPYTCFFGRTQRHSGWWCEQEPGQCQNKLNTVSQSNDILGRGGITPDGEGEYELLPSRRRMWCDKTFGCRPMR